MTVGIRLIYDTLDGKHIAYHSETVFKVQVGRIGRSYVTKHVIAGDLGRAVLWFNGYNVDHRHQKRLYCDTMNNPVLARVVGRVGE
jgi:hypothetical protein